MSYVIACEHIAGQNSGQQEETQPYILMRRDQFADILKKSIVKCIDVIETKHSKTQQFSKFIKDILKCVSMCKNGEKISKIETSLCEDFYELFKSPVLTPYDREIFFAKVHGLKINADLKQNFFTLLVLEPSERVNTLFYQCLIRELVESLLAQMIVINETQFENKPTRHTSTEQEVLYYIAGFIVKKVKGNIDKLRSLRGHENILCSLTIDKGESLGYLESVKSWTEALDRGGLQYPSIDFYLLVRELDSIVCNRLYDKLSSSSLLKCKTKDIVFDSYIINYYWGKILLKSGCADKEGKLFLEFVIDVFLNIKGFATARNVRMAQDSRKHKTSTSFRKSLQ